MSSRTFSTRPSVARSRRSVSRWEPTRSCGLRPGSDEATAARQPVEEGALQHGADVELRDAPLDRAGHRVRREARAAVDRRAGRRPRDGSVEPVEVDRVRRRPSRVWTFPIETASAVDRGRLDERRRRVGVGQRGVRLRRSCRGCRRREARRARPRPRPRGRARPARARRLGSALARAEHHRVESGVDAAQRVLQRVRLVQEQRNRHPAALCRDAGPSAPSDSIPPRSSQRLVDEQAAEPDDRRASARARRLSTTASSE